MPIRRHTTNIGNALFLLLLLLAHTALAAAAFRGFSGHGELHPHLQHSATASALIVQTQTTPGVPEGTTSDVGATSLFATTDIIATTTSALEPSSSDTNQLGTGSTDTPTLSADSVPPQASSSGSVVASKFLLRASASPSDASSLSTDTNLSQSISPPGPEAPISTNTQALPDTSDTSPSITKTIHPRPRLLVEIIVPAVLGLLTAGAIFEFYRRRRRRQRQREAKGWEGSRLPDLDAPGAGIWPFRRRGHGRGVPTTRTRRAGAGAGAYAGGGGDWNRSDAHLRAEEDVSEYGGGRISGAASARTLRAPAGTDQLEEQAWDPDPTIEAGGELFTGAFLSESPSHDEPALAESRPGSRISVHDSFGAL